MIFLRDALNVLGKGWWLTETKGWLSGMGKTSRFVDVSKRMSYQEGFVNIGPNLLPKEVNVNYSVAASISAVKANEQGLLSLNSWEDYYKVREIPLSSPVALLMTFPLTIYYAIQKYGEVPITVSRMLRRPLRVHVVGVEKELNFLDLFSEVGYLLPPDFSVSFLHCYSMFSFMNAILLSIYVSFPGILNRLNLLLLPEKTCFLC
jgi:hypothetical protein